jgi:chromosome segregation ATPase
MTLSEIAIVVAGTLGGSGVIGALYTIMKVRPESAGILIDAAQDVVIIQKGVIDDLRMGLKDAHDRITALENANEEKDKEATRLRAENKRLTERVRHLEREIELLSKNANNSARLDEAERRLTAEEKRNTDIETRADAAEKREKP